jgi:lactaldehyde reductase
MAVQEFQHTAFSPHSGSYLIPLNTDIRLIVLIFLLLTADHDTQLQKYFFNFTNANRGKTHSQQLYYFQRIMAIQRIVLNEVSYFGPGARTVIPTEVVRKGFKKALVVTDKELMKFGVAQKVTDVLVEAKIPYEIYDEIKPNPTVKNVKDGVAAFAKSGADFMIAIGGGSSMDTAKAIGIITNNPEFSDVVSLEGVADTKKVSVPIIAVPTTAGTAAEVTINYVITDEASKKKMVCVDPNDIPCLAIVDAEMMSSMPKGLTASTGMDALTHAIEGYITKGAWTISDMFELKAIELIAKHLKKAVEEPNNLDARDGMAVAQYVAGMGFSNVGLGVVHGMAHPLGAFYDIPHGVANALLLPYVMEYNMPAAIAKYRDIAVAMGVDVANMSDEDAAKAAVKAVKNLAIAVNIPQKLSTIGVKEEDLQTLAVSAFNDVCTPGNPREASAEDILAIYKKAF